MNTNLLKMKKNFKFIIMFGLMIFSLITCGNKQGDAKEAGQSANGDKKIKIVTTTTMLVDLAKIIGGDKVEVEVLGLDKKGKIDLRIKEKKSTLKKIVEKIIKND